MFNMIEESAMANMDLKLSNEKTRNTIEYNVGEEAVLKYTSTCHDIKNHLFIIYSYISIGDYEKAKRKIEEVCNIMVNKGEEISTGNLSIDSFLKIKTSQIKSCNINLEYISERFYIDPNYENDICIIMGNAIDNAIEACNKIKDRNIDKEIKISLLPKGGNIEIVIKNTNYSPMPVLNGKVTTSKSNNKHGLGLRIIKYTVEKYNGTFNLRQRDNKVCLKVLLPFKCDKF